ncbi:MAG: dipeptidase [Bacillota bacterium]|nr:dipeptidase [Bacillota bacterium]
MRLVRAQRTLLMAGILLAALAALVEHATYPVPSLPAGMVVPAIHISATVVDAHCDTLMRIVDKNGNPTTDIGSETAHAVDLPKLERGHVDMQFFAAFSSARYHKEQALGRCLALINAFHRTVREYPGRIVTALVPGSLSEAASTGRIAAVLALEGADFLGQEGPELLRQLHDLGVRSVGLTWNDSNALAEGIGRRYADGTPSTPGLTAAGRKIIAAMDDLGMIIDLSHASEVTVDDVLQQSRQPVIVTHTAAYALRQHSRNLSDMQARKIASNDGVICVMFGSAFLSGNVMSATVDTVVDHIDHLVETAGVDHVGIGSDFDGTVTVNGLENSSMMPLLTLALSGRGYSPADIEKIMGGNVVRIIQQVWKAEATGVEPFRIKSPASMGGSLPGPPRLVAEYTGAGRAPGDAPAATRVIVDGLEVPSSYDEQTGRLTAAALDDLTASFHVATFEITRRGGSAGRSTTIFRIP